MLAASAGIQYHHCTSINQNIKIPHLTQNSNNQKIAFEASGGIPSFLIGYSLKITKNPK